jgi:hypothetical protein
MRAAGCCYRFVASRTLHPSPMSIDWVSSKPPAWSRIFHSVVVGIIASATACVLAAMAGRAVASATAGAALALLITWLLIYLRISAPINRALTAAADRHETPTNARSLQHDWDHVIALRATPQGLAVAALCMNLMS